MKNNVYLLSILMLFFLNGCDNYRVKGDDAPPLTVDKVHILAMLPYSLTAEKTVFNYIFNLDIFPQSLTLLNQGAVIAFPGYYVPGEYPVNMKLLPSNDPTVQIIAANNSLMLGSWQNGSIEINKNTPPIKININQPISYIIGKYTPYQKRTSQEYRQCQLLATTPPVIYDQSLPLGKVTNGQGIFNMSNGTFNGNIDIEINDKKYTFSYENISFLSAHTEKPVLSSYQYSNGFLFVLPIENKNDDVPLLSFGYIRALSSTEELSAVGIVVFNCDNEL